MKTICDQRNWTVKPGATASALIDLCVEQGLFAKIYNSQLSSLRTLASGVPTVRNTMGGHGQGSEVTIVPEHMARYALNLTAANILFLVESNDALGR